MKGISLNLTDYKWYGFVFSEKIIKRIVPTSDHVCDLLPAKILVFTSFVMVAPCLTSE